MKNAEILKEELAKEEELFTYLSGQFESLTADQSELIKNLLKQDMETITKQLKKEESITILGIINSACIGIKEYLQEKADAKAFIKSAADTYSLAVTDNAFAPVYDNLLKATKQVNNMLAKVVTAIKKPLEYIKNKAHALEQAITNTRIKAHDAYINLRVATLDLTINTLEKIKTPFVTERNLFNKGVEAGELKQENIVSEIEDTNNRINFITTQKEQARAGLDRLLVNLQLLENKAHKYTLERQNKAIDKGIDIITGIRNTEQSYIEKFDATIVSLSNRKDELLNDLSVSKSDPDSDKENDFEFEDLG